MGKRRFLLSFVVYGGCMDTAIIELDDAVIEAVDDKWRSIFYELWTPEEIAEHIGLNLIINRRTLSRLDGWADQPDENAKVLEWPDLEDWDIEAEEIKNGKETV